MDPNQQWQNPQQGTPPPQPGGQVPPPQAPPQQAGYPPPMAPQQPGFQTPPAYGATYQAAPTKSSNGCLKAFIIVMIISIVLGIGITIAVVIIAGSAVDTLNKTFGTADPADFDLKINSCTVNETTGLIEANGQITNKTNHRQAFSMNIDFIGDNNVKLGDGFTTTPGLDAGQSGNFHATSFAGSNAEGQNVTCKQGTVSYFGF